MIQMMQKSSAETDVRDNEVLDNVNGESTCKLLSQSRILINVFIWTLSMVGKPLGVIV